MTINPLRLVLLLVLASLLAWCTFDWVADQRDTARSERDSAQSEAQGLREAARISGEMLAARDRIDLQRTEELNSAQEKNDALQRDVDAGNQRLSVRATCRPVVSAASSTGSVADAGTAELATDARQDYFTLRSQLALSKQMILGLQDYIRQVVMRSPATDSSQQSMETTP
ncbi:lysis system i-spanin subunit Rz [Pseudomonas violetae]|uniref:Lysis protein n=1 Tax=Pseudomonas violetae TaxID=2915813 RepID=A0ABT0EV80_9PSED|nr:lysis system i-spanin subunit Rz [Pseudomonas violetae]MCK1789648.1 lysis protein [Pseudomonas violetae]